MKKVLLIIGLLLTVTIVNSYNYPTRSGSKASAYEYYSINNGYIYDNTLYCYIYGNVY